MNDKEPEIKEVESPGGIHMERTGSKKLQVPYEQIVNEEGDSVYLTYRSPHIGLKGFTIENRIESFNDDGEPIQLKPMVKRPWPPCGPYPEQQLSHQQLWIEIKTFLHQHIDFSSDLLYDVVTGWVFATWIPEQWISVPYLFFHGPVSSGKTRALDCLLNLCYRGLMGPNISGPALFRGVELWQPTLLLDETEVYNKDTKSDVIGVLNAGYRRGQHAIRVVKSGDEMQLGLFDVFGFKALAGTQGHRQTLESRSITINMFKASRRVRFMINFTQAQRLRTQLLLWRLQQLSDSSDSSDDSDSSLEEVPEDLQFADGRFAEKYYPLYVVANEGRDQIIAYARLAYQRELNAEETSVEAEMIQAINKCTDKVNNRVIKLKDITQMFNQEKNDKEKWKSRTVGSIVKRLGFDRKRATGGDRGFIWDEQILNLNLRRYGLLDTVSTEPSLSSLPSLSSPEPKPTWTYRQIPPIFDLCEKCGKWAIEYVVDRGDEGELRRCDTCFKQLANEFPNIKFQRKGLEK